MKVFINFNSNFRATLISRVITYFLYLHSKMHDMNFESYPRKEKKNISFSQSFYFFGVLRFGFLCLFWAFFCWFGFVFPPSNMESWNHNATVPVTACWSSTINFKPFPRRTTRTVCHSLSLRL